MHAVMALTSVKKNAASSATRVPGTAVFMTAQPTGTPPALVHNLRYNKVLHERIILLTVKIEDVPYVEGDRRFDLNDLGSGFYRLILRSAGGTRTLQSAINDATSATQEARALSRDLRIALERLSHALRALGEAEEVGDLARAMSLKEAVAYTRIPIGTFEQLAAREQSNRRNTSEGNLHVTRVVHVGEAAVA